MLYRESKELSYWSVEPVEVQLELVGLEKKNS